MKLWKGLGHAHSVTVEGLACKYLPAGKSRRPPLATVVAAAFESSDRPPSKKQPQGLFSMAGPTGFKPAISTVTEWRFKSAKLRTQPVNNVYKFIIFS